MVLSIYTGDRRDGIFSLRFIDTWRCFLDSLDNLQGGNIELVEATALPDHREVSLVLVEHYVIDGTNLLLRLPHLMLCRLL